MKRIFGFCSESASDSASVSEAAPAPAVPVRSLVEVRFPGFGKPLTYLNEGFELQKNDMVYVSGKLAGTPGTVTKVITRFRVPRADYEVVLRKLELELHGTFYPLDENTVISADTQGLTPEQFASWVIPPVAVPPLPPCMDIPPMEEYISGEGYALSLSGLEASEDLRPVILSRGQDYFRQGKVAYLSLRDGIVTAYVEGTRWYRLDFALSGDSVTELYCQCPYPELCKHAVAALLLLRQCLGDPRLKGRTEFTALSREWFWRAASHKADGLTL